MPRRPRTSTVLGWLVVLAAAAVCLRLGWWQWTAARQSGRVLNYSYAVEWVLFAGFAVVAWVKVLRTPAERPEPLPTAQLPVKRVVDEDLDDETRAYNEYLARLHQRPS